MSALTGEELAQVEAFMNRHFHGVEIVKSKHGWTHDLKAGGVALAAVQATTGSGTYGYSGRRIVTGYEVSGPFFPMPGNRRYGNGVIRRKLLAAALEASLPYMRTASPYEAAREASQRSALVKGEEGAPSTQDAMLVELFELLFGVFGHFHNLNPNDRIPGLRERVQAIKARAQATAAAQAMREIYAHFDAQLKGPNE